MRKYDLLLHTFVYIECVHSCRLKCVLYFDFEREQNNVPGVRESQGNYKRESKNHFAMLKFPIPHTSHDNQLQLEIINTLSESQLHTLLHVKFPL